MLHTLKAVINGEKIYWQEAVGGVLPANQPVNVLVTVLEKPNDISAEEKGQRRLEALQQLQKLDAFSGIPNPDQWERETRKERDFPQSA